MRHGLATRVVAVVLLASAFCLMPFAPARAGETPLLPSASDLAADGAQAAARKQPVVILFSLPGCPYCEVVRRNYLIPLVRDLPPHLQPVIREVQLDGSAAFSGFGHERLTGQDLARHYGIRYAPTVVLLDRAGTILSAPIVGGDTAGLYGGYLDNAFAEAARKLAAGH